MGSPVHPNLQALGKYSGSVRLWREFIDMHTRFLDEAHTTLQDVLHAHGEALRVPPIPG